MWFILMKAMASELKNLNSHQGTKKEFTPQNQREAMNCAEADKWIKSQLAELESLVKHDVFAPTSDEDARSVENVTSTKFVYKIKNL